MSNRSERRRIWPGQRPAWGGRWRRLVAAALVPALLLLTLPGWIGVSQAPSMPPKPLTKQMPLTALGGGDGGPIEGLEGAGCETYPIAILVDLLVDLQPGDTVYLWNKDDAILSTFGWIRWDPDAPNGSAAYLVQEIYNPGMAVTDFTNARDPYDTTLSVGDWVASMSGNFNFPALGEALDWLMTQPELRVVVYDAIQGAGSDYAYHVFSFAMIRLIDYHIPAGNELRASVEFLGWDQGVCPEAYPDLAILKSGPHSHVGAGQALTYTLAFTNVGDSTAAGVVISDLLPITLTHVGFTHSGAAITRTPGITYAWRVQDLETNQGGTITVTGEISAVIAGPFALTNTAIITGTRAESVTTNNRSAIMVWVWGRVYLPLVLNAAPSVPSPPPGSISGTTYGDFSALGGATVILYRQDTGLELARTQSTQGSGSYSFTDLVPNRDYNVWAEFQQGNTLYCGQASVWNLFPNEDRVADILLIDCDSLPYSYYHPQAAIASRSCAYSTFSTDSATHPLLPQKHPGILLVEGAHTTEE